MELADPGIMVDADVSLGLVIVDWVALMALGVIGRITFHTLGSLEFDTELCSRSFQLLVLVFVDSVVCFSRSINTFLSVLIDSREKAVTVEDLCSDV